MNHGDIFWADLPEQGGRVQRGRRPVVIWHDTAAFPTPTIVVVPLTSKLDALRFPASVPIRPSPTNGLSVDSVAMLFQMSATDPRRIGAQLGRLDDADIATRAGVAKQLQKLP